jgi:hypothetical protein
MALTPRATSAETVSRPLFSTRVFAMQTLSLADNERPKPESIPYSKEALRQDLDRVRDAWAKCQRRRRRDAIYTYLSAVYELVTWWSAEGREVERARRALRSRRLEVPEREEPFAAIIRCTADPNKADARTRSKWSRVLRYAAMYKDDAEPLAQFVQRKGGINECVARYGRCLRRLAARRRSIAAFQRRSAGERTAVVRRVRS